MSAHGVVWRPHEHADEYIVFIDDEVEFKAWKEQPAGGRDIALARFIGNFVIVSWSRSRCGRGPSRAESAWRGPCWAPSSSRSFAAPTFHFPR